MDTGTSRSQTQQNLDAAFAGESMAYQKYMYFAKVARDLGDEEVARLFEDTAKQEVGHAFGHLSLIYPAGKLTVDKLLELAVEGERYEHTTMYPGFEEQARREHDLSAEREFREQMQESKEHDRAFSEMLEKARKRFGALAKVEKMHADRYEAARQKRRGR